MHRVIRLLVAVTAKFSHIDRKSLEHPLMVVSFLGIEKVCRHTVIPARGRHKFHELFVVEWFIQVSHVLGKS